MNKVHMHSETLYLYMCVLYVPIVIVLYQFAPDWYTASLETEHMMAKQTENLIVPNTKMMFTIIKEPIRPAARKTIERLMWMQPQIKRDLAMLQRRRKQKDIKLTIRAGRIWFDRPRATRTVRATKGSSFTIMVTPHIVNDLKSVSKYLSST